MLYTFRPLYLYFLDTPHVCVTFNLKQNVLIQYVSVAGQMKSQFLGKEKITFLFARLEGVTS